MILAADIGGTHARLALVAPVPGHAQLSLDVARTYRVADFPSLDALFDTFLAVPDGALSGVAIATAGTVTAKAVRAINLPWAIDLAAIERRFGADRVLVVNDFAAMAYALPQIPAADFHPVVGGAPSFGGDPVLVLGAGTGLGAAVLQWKGGRPLVLSTEAGQSILAPTTDGQNAVWQLIQPADQPLRLEDVLSGSGLLTLYEAILRLHDATPAFDKPEAVSRAALDGSDRWACETLEYFCSFLGSACAQLTLQYGSWGGLVIAGGIVPGILPLLCKSSFVERFRSHPTMAAPLAGIPISVTQHGQHAAIGAAHMYLDAQANPRAPLSLEEFVQ